MSRLPLSTERVSFRPLVAALALVCAVAGCDGDDHISDARSDYNAALEELAAGRHQEAIDGFLRARAEAGQDQELRFRATVNLGLAFAEQADMHTDPANLDDTSISFVDLSGDPAAKLEQARDLLLSSASWLQTALRLRPEEERVRQDLELVKRRILAITDQLNKSENTLEKRLERVIEGDSERSVVGQRDLRERIRQLTVEVDKSGSAAEPVEFQAVFEKLASMERVLTADVNTVSDLAGDELDLLRDKGGPDGEALEAQDKVRFAQLNNLQYYLQSARGELVGTRRALRKLQGQRAHRRADAALSFLVRAREQLLDPVTVLRSVAQDEMRLFTQTSLLVAAERGALQLTGSADEQAAAPTFEAPAWLTGEHLSDRQEDALQRTSEVLARFQAATAEPDPDATQPDATQGDAAAPQDPKAARAMESARAAVPFLERATEAMTNARTALTSGEWQTAAQHEREALTALANAIERFAEIRQLIELIYGEHEATIALLTPPDADADDESADPMAQRLAAMSTEERVQRIQEALSKNLERLSRLAGLFDDELATIDAQAAQAAQGQQAPQDPQQPDPHAQEAEARKQQYQRAHELREQTADALSQLASLVATASNSGAPGARSDEALALAATGKEHIEELRRLFLSLIEHLKELIAEQTKTFDETGSTASVIEPEEMLQRLGPLVEAQREHAAKGRPLTDAVAEQADAAAQSGEDPEGAERLKEAAEELRQATEEMVLASGRIADDLEAAQSMSPDLKDVMAAQRAAIDHLEAALELLQPPQQKQNQEQEQQQDQEQEQEQEQDQDQDQQQQQQQQQAQQAQQEQDMSEQQVQRRLQELRDRDAERQREKREQYEPEPVDKDW